MSTPHTPKPGPRPGAVPGPRPGAHAARKVVAPNVSAMNQARAFGRVDDDGTVYLIRGGETKKIGSWQAGTPEEGLQHYIHRFEDLATEVALLESRLKSHPNDASHIKEKAGEIRDGLDDAAVIGDLDSLEKRLNSIIDGADSAGEKARELKQQLREKAIEQKQKLVAEAEEIAEKSTDWKVAGDRIREILDEWKTIKGIDRKTDDELWKLYSRARDSFNRRRGSHFAELDRDREFAANAEAKDALIDEYTPLIDPAQGLESAREKLRELQEKWEAIGYVPRNRVREYEEKIANLEKRVTEAADAQWRRTDPAAQARAAQFISKVEEFTAQAAEAEVKGNTKKAEQLRAQAQQWQEWADAAINAVENR
ncbi:DUF349 domain-containing protein [Corynebacterium diphtheriae]